jgi:ataxia telangiectasia mutated family protein
VRIGGRDATTKEPKARTAREILVTVKAESSTFLAKLVENYELVTEAYNYLADINMQGASRNITKKIPFHEVCKKASLRLDSCLGKGTRRQGCPPCILTKTPVLRPGCDYGDGHADPVGSERILGFEESFAVVPSGASRPKIVMCKGTQGNMYKQLVKGEDDCRGDAVMLQVFGYVNELMMMRGSSRGKEGKRAPLRVVTYSVVPLSPRNGVSWKHATLHFTIYSQGQGA